MKVFYISSMFEDEFLDEIYDKDRSPNFAANKYHQLLVQGIAENNVEVNTYSVLPISKRLSTKFRIKKQCIKEKKLIKTYISFINVEIIKHIACFSKTFFKVLSLNKEKVIVYDVLVVPASLGAVLAAKIKKIKSIAIVTDLPEFMHSGKKSVKLFINNKLLSFANGYIFLTKHMNKKCNFSGRPFIVLEGHVDSKMRNYRHYEYLSEKKIVMYAGSLQKKYGIDDLVKAFMRCHKESEELHIYGDGDYRETLKDICKNDDCIKYYGTVSNEVVVDAELRATLLVNPRTTNGEYTKFSFPSKTLEYMVSGTPVLCAKLDGFPEDYDSYLFFFDDKKENDLERSIRYILDMDATALAKKGERARDYVLSHKNNIVQAKKIIGFLEEIQAGNLA